jgi:hypothetical protein
VLAAARLELAGRSASTPPARQARATVRASRWTADRAGSGAALFDRAPGHGLGEGTRAHYVDGPPTGRDVRRSAVAGGHPASGMGRFPPGQRVLRLVNFLFGFGRAGDSGHFHREAVRVVTGTHEVRCAPPAPSPRALAIAARCAVKVAPPEAARRGHHRVGRRRGDQS